jgi:hypothetical protein
MRLVCSTVTRLPDVQEGGAPQGEDKKPTFHPVNLLLEALLQIRIASLCNYIQ